MLKKKWGINFKRLVIIFKPNKVNLFWLMGGLILLLFSLLFVQQLFWGFTIHKIIYYLLGGISYVIEKTFLENYPHIIIFFLFPVGGYIFGSFYNSVKTKRAKALIIILVLIIFLTFIYIGANYYGASEEFTFTSPPADANRTNPLTIPQVVEINRNKQKTIYVTFYNKAERTALGSTLIITECLKENRTSAEYDKVPQIVSSSQNVDSSSAVGFNLILVEKGLPIDTYTCTIAAVCDPEIAVALGGECPKDNIPYETKEFFLNVIP